MSEKRTALVTGASGGIGRAIAFEMAARGCDVVAVARSGEALDEVCRRIREQSSGAAIRIIADLSSPESPREVCDELERSGTPIDILVNNAGRGFYGEFSGADWESQAGMIHLNIRALTELTWRLLPAMVERGYGRILNVASTAAFKPGPMMAVYNATKSYVLSFTEALASELGGTGVSATAVCPGATRTGFASAAGLDESQLPSYKNVPDAETVGAFAVASLYKERPVAIHGAANRAITFAQRFVPRSWVTAASRMVRGGKH